MINAPSLANSNILNLGQDLAALVESGVQVVHVDIMDGHYVPNLCFPVSAIRDIKAAYPDIVVDAHLMVDDVESYVGPLAEAGCDAMSFPSDATRFTRRNIVTIQAAGMRAGVAVNPSQPIGVLEPVLALADYAVLMSVEPGFAGQSFLPGSLDRLAELVRLKETTGSDALIEVDGGVTYDVAAESLRLGAEMLVTGVFTVYDPELGIRAAVPRFESAMAEQGFAADPAAADQLRRVH